QARAVGELGIPADRTAVGEVSQDRQPLLDEGVRLPALDVRDEANAASVVLVVRVIEPLRFQAHDEESVLLNSRTVEYTVIAPQRQWPRVPAAHRRRRAGSLRRSNRAARSAGGRARHSCQAASARGAARG